GKRAAVKIPAAPPRYTIDGYYCLMAAEGGTRYEHPVTLARAKSICGPYEVHPDSPLLTSYPSPRNPLQKAGHASMVQTHTGEWFLVHLTGRPLPKEDEPLLAPRGYCPLGRATAIHRLEWRDGRPHPVGSNQPPPGI